MKQEPTSASGPSKKEGMTPGELLKKHLHDKDHVVTDEELQQVRVGIDAEDEKEVEEKEKEIEGEIKIMAEKHPPNPYDVLGG